MQKKRIAMMLVSGFAIGMLTGCGVPEEEHLAALASQEAAFKAEEGKLKEEIERQKDLVTNEKAKVRTARIEMDDATERIKGLQQKSAETAKALTAEKSTVADLESQLKTSKSMASSAREQANAWEEKYNALQVEFQEVKRRFEMFKKNMSALAGATDPQPAAAVESDIDSLEGLGQPVMEEPKSDAQKALGLLEQMGNM